jgi:hypothetical protein
MIPFFIALAIMIIAFVAVMLKEPSAKEKKQK